MPRVTAAYMLGAIVALLFTSPVLSASDAVRCVQQELNALGYNAGSTDGLFGQTTFRASEAYRDHMSSTYPGWSMPALSEANAAFWCEKVGEAFPRIIGLYETYNAEVSEGAANDDLPRTEWMSFEEVYDFANAHLNRGSHDYPDRIFCRISQSGEVEVSFRIRDAREHPKPFEKLWFYNTPRAYTRFKREYRIMDLVQLPETQCALGFAGYYDSETIDWASTISGLMDDNSATASEIEQPIPMFVPVGEMNLPECGYRDGYEETFIPGAAGPITQIDYAPTLLCSVLVPYSGALYPILYMGNSGEGYSSCSPGERGDGLLDCHVINPLLDRPQEPE